ncbi:MAG: phosphodiester glycosidase family protein [Myxococcales bacterium]|nr:phosphodiester glycosidase family protein [Myxococcales bacterium]
MSRLALALIAASASVAAAAPTETSTAPYPGVTHVRWSDVAVQQRAHFVLVDLSFASLTLRATDEVDRGKTASQIAAVHGAQLAINGDLFAPAGYVPDGLAVGASGAWTSAHDDDREAVLRFGKTVAGTDALIVVPESVVAPADLPEFVTGALGGRPMLVRAGQIPTSFDCGDPDTIACQRAPRTAIGLSADRRTMIIAVVDGWQAGALGQTAAELAALMVARGARDAILVDGGSSSTLFIASEGGVVSSPSDGSERAVANHLTIKVGPPQARTLFGVVREGNIITGPDLGGVRVTLDDGRAVTTAAVDSSYTFDNVPIRYVCVDATKIGYDPVHQCKQMDPANAMTFNSIAMLPAGTGPDAGVDAAIDAPAALDAAPGADGGGGDGAGPDAGPGDGATGGCCRTSGGGGDGAPVATAAAFVVFAWRRSRRRTR